MARGRGISSANDSSIVSSRQREPSPEYDAFSASSKAYRLSAYDNSDACELSKKSKTRDKDLLSDITRRLNRMEYDGVKAGKDVISKTGFRRMLYNRTYVPLEKETREKRRLNELRYPWDNTITDNVFRGVKQKSKASQRRAKLQSLKEKSKDYKEYSHFPVDLPERDPMGVYRPTEKRERKDLDYYSHTGKKYDLTIREVLAKVRAKVEALPRQRSTQKDVDEFLADITRPLPRNDEIKDFKIATIDAYPEYDAEMKRRGLDDHLKKKVKESQNDLAEFERLLNDRFGPHKPKPIPSRVVPAAKIDLSVDDEDIERERELGLEPSFEEPTIIHRHARAPVRAVHHSSALRPRVSVPVHASPRVRVRSSSVPASPRLTPRHRSRMADIEVEEYLADFDEQI